VLSVPSSRLVNTGDLPKGYGFQQALENCGPSIHDFARELLRNPRWGYVRFGIICDWRWLNVGRLSRELALELRELWNCPLRSRPGDLRCLCSRSEMPGGFCAAC
jgi:hypothetical protein